MKVAYVTTYDSSDINAWSGSGIYILRALQNSGIETELIENLKNIDPLIFKLKKLYYERIKSQLYLRHREPKYLINYASQVENALKYSDCRVVFSPGTIPIAYLETEKPIVFWTDATFAGMVNFYPNFSNLCTETLVNGNTMEQLALSKCCMAIYSSEWAANTAIQNYDVDPAKVKIIPFGANVDCDRTLEDINIIIKNKDFSVCKLLFIGVDWLRKGGNVALEVADLLNQRGIKTELHVVGCDPAGVVSSFVIEHGFISKRTIEGKKYLDKLMSESHFLILPSIADCVPVVFAEASSFGLPSLSTNIGGIPTAIQNGKNGQTFSLNENPEKYADYIENWMSSKQEYYRLAFSSFTEYLERLNWTSSGRKVYELIHEFCD
jgi:glycosyltransferase involved in cell wall biosynthesis